MTQRFERKRVYVGTDVDGKLVGVVAHRPDADDAWERGFDYVYRGTMVVECEDQPIVLRVPKKGKKR